MKLDPKPVLNKPYQVSTDMCLNRDPEIKCICTPFPFRSGNICPKHNSSPERKGQNCHAPCHSPSGGVRHGLSTGAGAERSRLSTGLSSPSRKRNMEWIDGHIKSRTARVLPPLHPV